MKLRVSKHTSAKSTNRLKKKIKIRKTVNGTAERPRLCVFRSLGHIYVQAIDDESSVTLASASSTEKALKEAITGKTKVEVAYKIGEVVAAKCKEKGIEAVVFDRGGFKYHGRVLALADGARKGGLKF